MSRGRNNNNRNNKPPKQVDSLICTYKVNSNHIEKLQKQMAANLNQILVTVEGIKSKVNKEKPKYFIWAQVAGTSIVLLAWFLQNNNINKFNSEILRIQSIRNEISILIASSNFTSAKIDLYEKVIDKADTNFDDHLALVDAYGDFCLDQLAIKRITIEAMPDGAMIGNLKLNDSLRREYYREFREDSFETEKYRNTADLQKIRFWKTTLTITIGASMKYLTNAAATNKRNQERIKDHLNKIYILAYILGSILILIGQLKDFKKLRLPPSTRFTISILIILVLGLLILYKLLSVSEALPHYLHE